MRCTRDPRPNRAASDRAWHVRVCLRRDQSIVLSRPTPFARRLMRSCENLLVLPSAK